MNPEQSPTAVLAPRSRLRSVAGPESTVDRVTAEIRRGVLNGTLAAGSSFSIVDLSGQLGVSHIPVRESLRRLEAQGLVELRPGRSAMVNPLDRDELRAIYRLRRDIEPSVAARACPLLTDDDLQEAERLLAEHIRGDRDSRYAVGSAPRVPSDATSTRLDILGPPHFGPALACKRSLHPRPVRELRTRRRRAETPRSRAPSHHRRRSVTIRPGTQAGHHRASGRERSRLLGVAGCTGYERLTSPAHPLRLAATQNRPTENLGSTSPGDEYIVASVVDTSGLWRNCCPGCPTNWQELTVLSTAQFAEAAR